MIATATIDLRRTESEFWTMTPRTFAALTAEHSRAERTRALNQAIFTAHLMQGGKPSDFDEGFDDEDDGWTDCPLW